jgi:putative glutamine amidotransferase
VTGAPGCGPRPLIGPSCRRWPAALLGAALPAAYADAGVDLGIGDYPAAIAAAGGLPVHLAPDAPAGEIVARLDGLVLTGGADIDPSTALAAAAGGSGIPGGATVPGGDRPVGSPAGRTGVTSPPATEPDRDRFELGLLRAALDADVPVLAICRGLQLLNVARGGTLVADLPAGAGDDHARFAGSRHDRVHTVSFAAGSLAASLYGPSVVVNSLHHQAVDALGDGLVAVAASPDGTVEALELPGRAVLAVQWHPESLPDDPCPGWLVAAALAGQLDRGQRKGR